MAEGALDLDPTKRGAEPAPGPRDWLANVGAALPFAIAAYMLGLAALRIEASPFLQIDEAEFVGYMDLRLFYPNAQPPLYTWLMRLALTFSDWSWVTASAAVKFALLGGYYYFVWDTARRISGYRGAALAVAAAAFLPQVVWMPVHTLAHSVLAMTAAAGVVNMTLRALQRPAFWLYVQLGLLAAAGVLGKLTFLFFLVPFVAAMAWSEKTRLLFRHRNMIACALVFLAAVAPMVWAALGEIGETTRIGRLYHGDGGTFDAIDPPFLGLDGLISLVLAGLAWAGLLALFWTAARGYDRTQAGLVAPSGPAAELGDAIGRAILAALALMAAAVLVADVHNVDERYLTPALAAAPIYAALRWPLGRAASGVTIAALLAFLAAPVAFWVMVQNAEHRFARPYQAVGAQIRRQTKEPVPLFGRHDDVANVVLALGWPGARTPKYQAEGDRIVALWRGRGDAPTRILAEMGYGPAAAIATVVAPYTNNYQDEPAVYSFQLFERITPQ